MALVDPNIALSIRTPDFVGQTVALRNAGLQQQLGQQALQEGQYRLQDAGLEHDRGQAVRKAFSDAAVTNPDGSVSIDQNKVVGTLAQAGYGDTAAELGQKFALQKLAAQQQQAGLTKTQLENHAATLATYDKLFQSAKDEPSYQAALQEGQRLRLPGIETAPASYDPGWVAQKHAQVLSAQDVIGNQLKQAELDETKKYHTQEVAARQATVPPANKAIAIYAIPKQFRTPEQNAFITGYERNNNVTRIAPAQVRIQGLLQMPEQVVDPATGKTVYTTKSASIGKEAPSSVDNVVNKALARDFTSGADAHTLTAFNTAQGHLQQLNSAAAALKNGNVTALNSLANSYGVATGKSAPVVFQAVKTALTGEIAKAFTGSGATVSEVNEVEKSINAANSPEQLQQVATIYSHLLDTKKAALAAQYQQGRGGQPNFGPQSQPIAPAADHPFFSKFGGSAK